MKQAKIILLIIAALPAIVFFACQKTVSTTGNATETVSTLNCSGVTFSATATNGTAYVGTATVPYTGGGGASYAAGSAISSTGVAGLTAILQAGTLTTSTGNVIYTIGGTPASSGTASFAISFGGQSCNLSLTVNASGGGTTPTVSTLTCASTTFSATATVSVAYTGTATVPYTGGNGIAYTTGTAISSTGVTGLTASLVAGTLASGAGNLIYNITGTAASTGTASFAITFGGQTCSFGLTVSAASSCSSLTGVDKVVCLANTFLSSLTTAQQAQVVQTLNLANAKLWSNLPCALSCRDGILFSSLTATQLVAAKAVIQAATGTGADEGFSEFMEINSSDSLLNTVSPGGAYSSGNYVICFLGTPTTTGKWMLQFGGHHYAGNITYNAGAVVSITPSHQGIEPKTWTTATGITVAPLATEQSVMANMLASFTSTELASAKISSTFSDVTMVPGSTTNTFPATKLGIKVSNLSSAAQAMVLAAMMPWINDLDATSAAAFTTIYSNELANTYVCYASNTGGTSGNASSFFTTNTDYIRIDGPGVWIEFICQTGVVFPTQIHYHSVFRDHTRDYIGL